MMCLALVIKSLLNIVANDDAHHLSCEKNAGTIMDEASTTTTHVSVVELSPTQDQERWDGRVVQAHALIDYL